MKLDDFLEIVNPVPLIQIFLDIGPHNEPKLAVRIFQFEGGYDVYRVTWFIAEVFFGAKYLDLILRQFPDQQVHKCQTLLKRGQIFGKSVVIDWNQPYLVENIPLDQILNNCQMPQMWRIKGGTQNTDFLISF